MKGDVIVIEEHHRRAAQEIVAGIVERVKAKSGRFTLTVAGESGSGKSETGAAIAEALEKEGLTAVVLGQDDYFVLPPKSNDAKRREDPSWLGPHLEVRLELLNAHLQAAQEGAESITKPLVDYQADAVEEETISLESVKVVIAEGTYTSLLRHVDMRVFIARNRLDTLKHRQKRNRGGEAFDPFIEEVLKTEHKIIAGHVHLADVVITKEYEVVFVDG